MTHVFAVAAPPEGTKVENPPSRYVTAIITEKGVARAPFEGSLRRLGV